MKGFDLLVDMLVVAHLGKLRGAYKSLLKRLAYFRERSHETGRDDVFMQLWKNECWKRGVNPADVRVVAAAVMKVEDKSLDAGTLDTLAWMLQNS